MLQRADWVPGIPKALVLKVLTDSWEQVPEHPSLKSP